MNKDRIIKISNAIGLTSIILLIYWVFIFISITVFDLKVFRENLTESFYLSILGILALMFGALMINIMFNLTKISDYVAKKIDKPQKRSLKISSILLLVSFPVIFILLYSGDLLTSKQKKEYLINSAHNLVEQYPKEIDTLANYTYTKNYLKKAEKLLNFLSKTDENFPYISIIVRDTVESSVAYLNFRNYQVNWETKEPLDKIDYIYSCSKEEREYLNSIFDKGNKETRFSSHDGNYELFFPLRTKDGKVIVVYFSEYQRYGKIGS